MPWQLSGNGRSGWSTKLIRGLKAEAAAGFQSRRERCREPTPVTPQYAAFTTYKAADVRLWHKADIASGPRHVRFTPKSGQSASAHAPLRRRPFKGRKLTESISLMGAKLPRSLLPKTPTFIDFFHDGLLARRSQEGHWWSFHRRSHWPLPAAKAYCRSFKAERTESAKRLRADPPSGARNDADEDPFKDEKINSHSSHQW